VLDISQTKNDEPVQPILLNFPKTNSRAFNSKLYTMFNWLEYSINEDSVFCFPCRNFFI
ncbi:zinc finger MYM-type protein 1-like, partial [Aphis craccivora]